MTNFYTYNLLVALLINYFNKYTNYRKHYNYSKYVYTN